MSSDPVHHGHSHRHGHSPSPSQRPKRALGDPLVTGSGLVVQHGQRRVLNTIDLTVHAGEVVTLIGPNGAGKTTLVRAVLGLQPLTSGRIQRRPGLRIGYMPQRLSVDATLPLTVRRFLGLWGGRWWRGPSPEQLDRSLKDAGVHHLAESPIQAVSGGEMQRVLLARALLNDPDLLVLDEPDQAVDVHGQAELFARIETLRSKRGCGVLLVSHDLHTVMARTDRVLCLNGHVCCSGTPEDVSRHPEYAALFGSHAADLAVYVHHHDHAHGHDGQILTDGRESCCHD